MSSLTLVIKPTNACNLRCKYCYVDPNAENGNMSLSVLEKLISGALSVPGKENVRFIWHGGEPLLMGVDFYREAVSMQKKYGGDRTISNNIQSNATLVNDDFLDFFEGESFRFGTSLDGPRELNDLTRVYADGHGAFDDIWAGLQKVKERNNYLAKRGKTTLGGGAIAVLSKKNLSNLNEIYDFFKSNSINFKLSPLIKSGRAKQNYEDLGIDVKDYALAMNSLFDRWFYESGEGVSIDPLDTYLEGSLTGRINECCFGSSCRKSFLSIGPLGDVYPCGKFEGISNFHLGSLGKSSVSEILSSDANQCLSRSKEDISGCLSCKYSSRCNGGCIHNSYTRAGNTSDKDVYCPAYKLMFKHIDEAVSKEIVLIKKSSKLAEQGVFSNLKGGDVNGK